MFYLLEPEVAGHFGPNTVGDLSKRPPQISRFHYVLDGWLGDGLLETVSCYIVTDRLRKVIENIAKSGFEFSTVEVSTSHQFSELYPNRKIPIFWWLKVLGRPGIEDLGMSDTHCLVVSDDLLDELRKSNALNHCEVQEWS